MVADIKRAFLHISVCPDDRDYLRFFWKDETGKTTVFRHKRVVFGWLVYSPYLLNAVNRNHLNNALKAWMKT